tara:strand:- start:411 stop:1028 length:618 start_codon:yes stop_codon:yes gene_type:complete
MLARLGLSTNNRVLSYPEYSLDMQVPIEYRLSGRCFSVKSQELQWYAPSQWNGEEARLVKVRQYKDHSYKAGLESTYSERLGVVPASDRHSPVLAVGQFPNLRYHTYPLWNSLASGGVVASDLDSNPLDSIRLNNAGFLDMSLLKLQRLFYDNLKIPRYEGLTIALERESGKVAYILANSGRFPPVAHQDLSRTVDIAPWIKNRI